MSTNGLKKTNNDLEINRVTLDPNKAVEFGVSKLIKTPKKEITEDQKEDNMLSNLGLSRDDLDDSGDMLEELKEIVGFYED